MNYVISDIHGCYDKYTALMDKLKLSDNDRLFVLGDVIDRGRNGLKILLDMHKNPNITVLMGNHEATALICLPLLIKLADGELSPEELKSVNDWFSDGGKATAKEFLSLSAEDKAAVLDIMGNLPTCKELRAGGRRFILVHAGLGNFSPEKKLTDYSLEELIYERPRLGSEYFTDRYIVFGHTPTAVLRSEIPDGAVNEDDIYLNGNLIGVDCGSKTHRLGCFCPDTMECFYV